MTSVQQIPSILSEQTVSATPRTANPFLRFLFWLLLPFPFLYLLAFPLVRTSSFERWCPSQWGPILEWSFDAAHQDADVVIFGDSSAFLGIDPRLVNAQLGIKTIVLPNTIGSLPVTGDLALRRYLATNRPPRLIVFYFSSWNLDYAHAQDVRLFEGEEMMLRHSSWPTILAFGLKHPLEVLAFPLRLYSTFGPNMITAALHRSERERDTARALGHMDDREAFARLSEPCKLPAKYFTQVGDASVKQLARTFGSPQTRSMVYLAPIPHCSNSAVMLQRGFPALGASPPAELPANGFLSDSYFAHIEPDYVPEASRLFANVLRERLLSEPTAP